MQFKYKMNKFPKSQIVNIVKMFPMQKQLQIYKISKRMRKIADISIDNYKLYYYMHYMSKRDDMLQYITFYTNIFAKIKPKDIEEIVLDYLCDMEDVSVCVNSKYFRHFLSKRKNQRTTLYVRSPITKNIVPKINITKIKLNTTEISEFNDDYINFLKNNITLKETVTDFYTNFYKDFTNAYLEEEKNVRNIIFKLFPNLHHIDIPEYMNFSSNNYTEPIPLTVSSLNIILNVHLSEELLCKLKTNLSLMNRLNKVMLSSSEMSLEEFDRLFSFNNSVETIIIHKYDNEEIKEPILSSFPNLTSLEISTQTLCYEISNNITKLNYLNLCSANYLTLINVIKNNPDLEEVYFELRTKEDISHLNEVMNELGKLKKLKKCSNDRIYKVLRSNSLKRYTFNWYQVIDLNTLDRNFPNVEEIYFYENVFNFTNSDRQIFPHLRKLVIKGENWLNYETEKNVMKFLTDNAEIEEIFFYFNLKCDYIRDLSKNILKMKKLKKIDLFILNGGGSIDEEEELEELYNALSKCEILEDVNIQLERELNLDIYNRLLKLNNRADLFRSRNIRIDNYFFYK